MVAMGCARHELTALIDDHDVFGEIGETNRRRGKTECGTSAPVIKTTVKLAWMVPVADDPQTRRMSATSRTRSGLRRGKREAGTERR